MKLLPIPEGIQGYSESAQEVSIRSTFLNKTKDGMKPMFAPVKCRDYYNDILHSQWSGKKGSIYGFTCDPETQHLDADAIRMLLVSPSAKVHGLLKSNLEGILHMVEEQNKFSPTTVTIIDDKHIVLEGDVRWQSSSLLLGVYTLLFRVAGRPIKDLKNWYDEILGGKAWTSETQFHHGTAGKLRDLIPKLGKFAEISKGESPAGIAKEMDVVHAHGRGIIGWCRPLTFNPNTAGAKTYKGLVEQALAA